MSVKIETSHGPVRVAAEKQFDLLVFIGRFQPFHNEHKRIIDTAVEKADKVLILVGSSGKARTIRNPFTFAERRRMIQKNYPCARAGEGSEWSSNEPLIIKPLFDKTYNDTAWIKQVQTIVTTTALDIKNKGGFHNDGIGDMRIGLIGASKDATSYYLELFPQWESVNVPLLSDLNSTVIRNDYWERGYVDPKIMPVSTYDFLYGPTTEVTYPFYITQMYKDLRAEYEFAQNYKAQWKDAPYPVIHSTVDTVVEQSGHILLAKRRSLPGKGLWSLAGGYLKIGETQVDGAIRCLKEKTGIKVPEPVLHGSIVDDHTFDDPNRSALGRGITRAYHIKLRNDTSLPKLKGSDDDRKWFPVADIKEELMYDDHYHIIHYFLGH
jgi:bifunctional NMN adenylyltransferase/nudix hydrolase